MLTLCLLGATASAQSPAREMKRQQVILSSDTTAPVPRVRLSPDVLTLFVFDAAIDAGALSLGGRGTRLSLVDAGERSLLVKPLVELSPGEAHLLAVPFKDGMAPASASFVLVSSPKDVDERVEVLRQPLSAAACQEQLEKERGRCAQQDALIAELRARAAVSDVAGLIFSGRMDEKGVSGTRSVLSRSPGIQHGLQVVEGEGVLGLRASHWAALALKVRNLPEQQPWKPGKARLTSIQTHESVEVLSVQLEAQELGAGEAGLLVVETRAPPAKAGAVFTLELWDASGGRSLTVSGVRLPAAR